VPYANLQASPPTIQYSTKATGTEPERGDMFITDATKILKEMEVNFHTVVSSH